MTEKGKYWYDNLDYFLVVDIKFDPEAGLIPTTLPIISGTKLYKALVKTILEVNHGVVDEKICQPKTEHEVETDIHDVICTTRQPNKNTYREPLETISLQKLGIIDAEGIMVPNFVALIADYRNRYKLSTMLN